MICLDYEEIFDHVNKIVREAIIHGGDPGGPYYCNEDELRRAMDELVKLFDADAEYEVREEITPSYLHLIQIKKKVEK